MIGWRPYLVTLAALLVLVAVGLDWHANGAKADPCKSADALSGTPLHAKARRAYLSVLSANPASECAKKGLAATSKALCERSAFIASGAPSAARRMLVSIARADPPAPETDACLTRAFQALPPEK
jgi:hypothetical protein